MVNDGYLIKIAGDMFSTLGGCDEGAIVLEGDGSSPDVQGLSFSLNAVLLELDAANPEAAEVAEECRVLAAQVVPVIEVLHCLVAGRKEKPKTWENSATD